MAVDMQKMRIRLLDKCEELLHDIAGLTEAYPKPVRLEEAKEGPYEFEDIAVDAIEIQYERLILFNEQFLLQQVEGALRRIEDGTYGRCIVCGQPIPEKRLEAIPWASRCVKDEKSLN